MNGKMITAALSLPMIAVLLWVGTREEYSDDPFANALTVVTADDFARRDVPGRVIEYDAPASFDIMPDIDWGARSAYVETNLPIEPTLYGGRDNNLTVSCAQVAFSAIDGRGTLPGPVSWPPDALFSIARARNDTGDYMRYCQIQIGLVRPDTEGFQRLVQRCQSIIAERFPGTPASTEWNEGAFAVSSSEPVEMPHGTLVQAGCWHNSVSEHLHFETWFLAHLGD